MKTVFTRHSFDHLHALVVGDIILDHYLIGRVERISPEAPVPVVLHEEERYRLGGAANVALNMASLGATPHLVAVVGQDKGGARLIDLLEQEGLAHSTLIEEEGRVTTQKTRILARQQQLVRYDLEQTHPIQPSTTTAILTQVKAILEQYPIQVLVLQDYNKGLLTPPLIAGLIKMAKAHGVTTLADPKKANFLSYKGIDWFKPNLREVNEALEANLDEHHLTTLDLQRVGAEIRSILESQHILITLGAQGIFVAADQYTEWARTHSRTVADVCGAGDTVISVVALCAGAQIDLKTTLRLANLAGGQVCERVGVVPVDRRQLWEEYQHDQKD